MSDVSAKPAGPGAIDQSQISPDSLFDGVTDFEYLEIFNPLSVDFIGKFGVEKPVDIPLKFKAPQGTTVLTVDEASLGQNYGLGGFKNPDHRSNLKITNTTIIKAGQSLRMRGSEAQVVGRQLVNEIIQREGNRLMMADPTIRHNTEERIILKRGSINELMESPVVTIGEQLKTAVKESNEEEFPDAAVEERDTSRRNASEQSKNRKPGRPPKAQPSTT